MSAINDKITKEDEDNTKTNQDTGNQNIGAMSEGNVQSINPEIIGAKSESMHQSASSINKEDLNRQSGDCTDEVLQKNAVHSDKTHMSEKPLKTDSGEGSGDHTTKMKVRKEANNENDEIEEGKTSLKVVNEKYDKSESFLANCDKSQLKTGNDNLVDELTDDDMELRWDDDDGNNQVMTDETEKPGINKLEDILSEEEFFDENDTIMENSPHRDIAAKDNPNDKITTNKLEDILSEEEFLEETDMNVVNSKSITNTVISTDECKYISNEKPGIDKLEDILSEEEFLEEIDFNAEISGALHDSDILAEKSKNTKDFPEGNKHSKETEVNTRIRAEMDIPFEESVDNINAIPSEINKEKDEVVLKEVKLLKEPDIALVQNIKIKNTDTTKSNPKILTENSKIMGEDILEEDSPLEENKSMSTTLKICSGTDITTEKNLDDNTIESQLLQETETNLQEEVPVEKDVLNEDILKENEISEESENKIDKYIAEAKDEEESDNTVSEEKLLEETETNFTATEIIPDPVLMNEDLLLEEELLEESKTVTKITDLPEIDNAIKTGVVENEDAILEDKLLDDIKIISEIPDVDVSMEKVDDEHEEELHKDDHDESCSAMDVGDVDNIDQSIDEQTKIEEKNIKQPIESNKTDQKFNIPEEDIQTETNILESVEIKDVEKTTLENKLKPDELLPKTITKDVTPLNIINTNEQKSDSTSFEDSPVPIKTDHSLHKPDAMLEIPTQELIDIDETDLSINLDQSEAIDSPDDDCKILCDDDDVNEETVINEPVDKVSTDNTNVANVEKCTENVKENIENVKESINIENVDKRSENVGKSIGKLEKSTDIAKKTIENVDKAIVIVEKNTENNQAIENIEKTTENIEEDVENVDKCTDNVKKIIENIETSTDNVEKITEDAKSTDSVEKIAIDTIEESLERMFADTEPTEIKEAVDCKATTSQTPDFMPSTSSNKMSPDTSDEMPEVSDSLGLLAESSGRVMEDDEEPEDDDDGDDDDDFDQDESSNQISAEQSEDSNPTPSETEPARDEKEIDTPEVKEDEFQFTICNVEGKSLVKLDLAMDIEVEEEKVDAANDEETQSAVNALLKEVEGATAEAKKDSTEQPMDIETVKLSDTSDTDAEDKDTGTGQEAVPEQSKNETEDKQDKSTQSSSNQSPRKQLLITQSPNKQSPSKIKKLEITPVEASSVVNIVDLEESSSSEDDIQVVKKEPKTESSQPEEKPTTRESEGVTNVNIPTTIEIMCTSGGSTSEMVTKEGEVVISGIPKPPPHKPARLDTGEVSIKTFTSAEPLVIPETKINEPSQTEAQSKPKLGLEIFSLDSDDDETAAKDKPDTVKPASPIKPTVDKEEKPAEVNKCINHFCTSRGKEMYIVADAAAMAYYDAGRKRKAMVCLPCAEVLAGRTKKLIQGIKDMTPLLDLDMGKLAQDLVEISDSESEDEDPSPDEPKESIGETGAKFLEDNLTGLMNETWRKYDLDVRLRETQIMLDDEIEKLEQDSKEIDAMLNECQIATDKLRCELYATFEIRREETPALCIYDTPELNFIGTEFDLTVPQTELAETRQAKRRLSSTSEMPAKRPAIPLGYAPLDADTSYSAKDAKLVAVIENKMDDDREVSVVRLSAEAAPPDLPPPGELARPALRVSMPVYAMKNAFGPWLRGRILEIQPKNPNSPNSFSVCRVKFDHKTKTNGKVLPARCIAYAEPADVRMTIGTRLIALFKDSNKRESYYSGVVAEIPNPVNDYRYLVFFDDGYAQYVQHSFTRLVCESSPLVWEEVHPFSREFVREYLLAYPERPMVRLHEGQHLKTEWNGKWWSSRVTRVDASLAQVAFVGDGRREWIYRGSTRLAPLYLELRAAERHRPRPMPRSKAQPRSNMPYVEYTRSDEPDTNKQPDTQVQQQQNEEIRRQRAVAKKSTTVAQVAPPPQQISVAPGNLDTVTSRVVYYTPKNAVKPYKMSPHRCGPKCKRTDVLSLKELRTYNPLAKPLLSGWERQIVRFKGHKEVMYRAPCGRRVRSVRELHAYLRAVDSELPVDLFDFHHATHCLAEFVLNKCLVGKKDLSHGKENVPVPCVNYYDDSLPEFCSYNTERTPTAGVPLNLDPEFLCGCDCTDDCQDKSKCACWKMTLEGARTIGLHGPNVGYVYKRLPEPLPSGIYECNSRCKCKHTCLNRVAQHPLQLKLQVFKTLNRGWGIRALNDVPKGSFLCVYAGNLLTDATANLDGLNEGDEYLAELDYIEVVEQMKEGYEEDIPEADKKLDKKETAKDHDDDEDDEPSSSDEEDTASKTDKEDDDFRPGYIGLGVTEFSKRLRRREKSKKDKEGKLGEEKDKDTKEGNADEDCITISDDEEVREPSRFMVQAGMGANEFISKYKSVRTLFGKDEACYIMDAKVQGNIGRYLNHSCCPNVFVQNVFVDTHDPRFPWVAFFALSHIKAGTELTWNYNYDVGSVPGKVLYCYCGAPNCRGRLL